MKPYVICHMCTSIDGRILAQRWAKLLPGGAASDLFETTAASFGVGAWLVGTTTMREFAGRARPLPGTRTRVPRTDHLADRSASGFAIGADARGALRFQESQYQGDHFVLLVTERVSDAYLAHLRAAGVSYLFCGRERLDVRVALDKIARRLGQKRLMLEGGGTFNGAVLAAGLIDEISQVILPVVDGGTGIASFFDIREPVSAYAAAALRLLHYRRLRGGAHWFRYRVVRSVRTRRSAPAGSKRPATRR